MTSNIVICYYKCTKTERIEKINFSIVHLCSMKSNKPKINSDKLFPNQLYTDSLDFVHFKDKMTKKRTRMIKN